MRWKIDKSFELCLRRLARLIIFAHEPEHEGLKIGLIRHIVIANLSGGNEQICTCFEWQPIEKKNKVMLSTIQVLSFLLVGAFWGCTNPLLKRASKGIERVQGGWLAVHA